MIPSISFIRRAFPRFSQGFRSAILPDRSILELSPADCGWIQEAVANCPPLIRPVPNRGSLGVAVKRGELRCLWCATRTINTAYTTRPRRFPKTFH